MQKRLIALLVSSISFVTATAITAKNTLVSTSMLSGSSVGYKGVDECSKLKMFRVAILPFDTKGAKIDGDIDQGQLQAGLNDIYNYANHAVA